jgi:hypothetical protein
MLSAAYHKGWPQTRIRYLRVTVRLLALPEMPPHLTATRMSIHHSRAIIPLKWRIFPTFLRFTIRRTVTNLPDKQIIGNREKRYKRQLWG